MKIKISLSILLIVIIIIILMNFTLNNLIIISLQMKKKEILTIILDLILTLLGSKHLNNLKNKRRVNSLYK